MSRKVTRIGPRRDRPHWITTSSWYARWDHVLDRWVAYDDNGVAVGAFNPRQGIPYPVWLAALERLHEEREKVRSAYVQSGTPRHPPIAAVCGLRLADDADRGGTTARPTAGRWGAGAGHGVVGGVPMPMDGDRFHAGL